MANEMKEQPNLASSHGHRARLRERSTKGGPEAIPDYEMLELILYRAIARRDTKPLAKALLKKFGSFSDVINAPPKRLKEVSGVGDAVISELKLIKASALRLMEGQMSKSDTLSHWDELLAYCRASMAGEQNEQFRLICLNKRNEIIANEVQQKGTIDHTPVYIREIAKRALDLGATAIVLAHNHPSGDLTPSTADITMTRDIVQALEKLSILVHDHIIVSRDGYTSFREQKLI